jgi:TonB-linked SusC/RagA family outer membrane protein
MGKPFLFLTASLISLFLVCEASVYGQNTVEQKVPLTGKVVDEDGLPVIGATVKESGTSNGTATNADGKYSLRVSPNAILEVIYLGYETLKVPVNNRTAIDVKLLPETEDLGEVVVVGYGVRRKESLTGAVSAIRSSDIVTTKNENVQNMISGKIPGVRTIQNSAEPGAFNTEFDVRDFGTALVVIDGVPRKTMNRIDPNDIESISVLKDASAAIYGVRASGGVVLITTKSGSSGHPEISYSGNFGWQVPSGFPDLVDAVEWMTLYNEKSMHSRDNQRIAYGQEQIDQYRNGTLQSVDWKSAVFRNSAPQSSHNISASGGAGKRINYYMSMGYMDQGSFLKTNDLNYNRFNMRSNISAKLIDNLNVSMSLSSIMDEKNQPNPGNDTYWIIRNTWTRRPIEPIYANNQEPYFSTVFATTNPVPMMYSDVTGYRKTGNKYLQSSVSATYDVSSVKGLKIKGMYSYDYNIVDNKIFRKAYNEYTYDAGTDTYLVASTLQAPNNVRREYYAYANSLWNVALDYDRKFGGHKIGALLVYERGHDEGDNFYASQNVALPVEYLFAGDKTEQVANMTNSDAVLYKINTEAIAGRLNYDYKSKYLIEFLFRYDSSSKFPPNSRWALFPSILGGYLVSEESFWKNSALSFINYLKFRVSYGETGDDAAMLYQQYQGYNYPAGGSASGLPGGYIFNGTYVPSSVSSGVPNKNITWRTSKITNVGLDFNAWNRLFGGTFEVFRRNRYGLMATRQISLPDIVGVALPQENLNSDATMGFEIELTHVNKIGDVVYNLCGNVALARTKAMYVERTGSGNSYLNWKDNNTDRWNNKWFAYNSNGRFTSWDQIMNSPVYIDRNALPGDYNYEDWNGDGMISDLDTYPLASGNPKPLVNFGLTINVAWKGIDLNVLLQGATRRTISYSEMLLQPLWAETNALAQFMDRWHPADPAADPYDPDAEWIEGHYAYTNSLPNVNSVYNMQDASYLRLKSLELGYTFPYKWTKKAKIKDLRFYVNGYNLLTATKLRYVDPEHPTTSYGYLYPLNKTVNVGLNLKF